MSFSFDFEGDDISDSDTTDLQAPIAALNIDDDGPPTPVPVKKWTLTELLSTLPDQISYNTLHIPIQSPSSSPSSIGTNQKTNTPTPEPTPAATASAPTTLPIESQRSNSVLSIPKRSLFDIRTQLMAEAHPANTNDALLSGLEGGDLSTGEYEGGFKTWECAVDLAGFALDFLDEDGASYGRSWHDEKSWRDWSKDGDESARTEQSFLQGRCHVIELGCGSAVPTLVLLQNALREARDRESKREVRFTLCDYNEDVLKLCTAPNVLLSTLLHQSRRDGLQESSVDSGGEQDFDIEAALPNGPGVVEDMLRKAGVTVNFISGPWSESLLELLDISPSHTADNSECNVEAQDLLILASETIYSPSTLPVFTDTIMALLKAGKRTAKSRWSGSREPVALVAAKKIYFGVGGGTDEFERCVRSRGGMVRTVFESTDGGVGRVILAVRAEGGG